MAYRWLVLAGDITGSYGDIDHAEAHTARFDGPCDVALNPARSLLYVLDHGNHKVRTITLSGSFPVATLADLGDLAPRFVHVHPTSGNLYVTAAETGPRNVVCQITPAGTVTEIIDLGTADVGSALPDTAETYVRVKINVGAFTPSWRWYRISDGADISASRNDGAFGTYSGQMMTAVDDMVLSWREYVGPSGSGAALDRAVIHGGAPDAAFAYFPNAWDILKLVPGADHLHPTLDTAVGLHATGVAHTYHYSPDPASLTLDTGPAAFNPLGLPALPARTLERDPVHDIFYFPTATSQFGASTAGARNGVPFNCVVVATPRDDLTGNYLAV